MTLLPAVGQPIVIRIPLIRTTWCGRKEWADIRSAVRQTALRDASRLETKRDEVNRIPSGVQQGDGFAGGAQTKIDVIGTGGQIAIGDERSETVAIEERQGGESRTGFALRIIRNAQSFQRHGQQFGIEQLKPVRARAWAGHPFIDADESCRTEGLRPVYGSGSRLI